MKQDLFTETVPPSGVEKVPKPLGKSRGRRNDTSAQVEAKELPFKLDAVYLQNCVAGMRALPDHCIDIAIADPPYNTSKGGEWKWDNSVKLPGFGGNWSKVMESWDSMPFAEYVNFTASWLSELKRVVKPTGSIWIHGTYHNIGIINYVLQLLEVEIINEVIWYKRNSFPNLAGRRLTASHETILWAHTGKRRQYHFNYPKSKEMDCPGDFLKSPGKQMRTVWDIPNNKEREELRFGKHPTQKPLRLLRRMLEISAKPGWVCLVPFAGAGSECVAAKRFGLRFLAFETDPAYREICQRRIDNEQSASLFPAVPEQLPKPLPKIDQDLGNGEKLRASSRVPSLIKWTGSKRSQAAKIRALMPPYSRYCEPFLGGGALLYLAASPGSIASDIYEPLIQLWKTVQADPETLIRNYRNQWAQLQADFPGHFYKVRDRFNREQDPLDLSFLMRTCVNGIVRFNDKGEFNNSFHLSRKGMTPERFENAVRLWSERIQGVRFLCQDYEATVATTQPGDFVYFDPPYAGSNQRYTSDLDCERLFRVLDDLNRRGVKWALSFDGHRGSLDLTHPVPKGLYKRKFLLASGNSPVGKVLNGPVEEVKESLYLNY
jgi:site-specific DNA-methyltransferase (adenine-specific)